MAKYSAAKFRRRLIQERIRILQKIDLRTIDDDALERQVRKLLGAGYISRLLQINKAKLYRVRINDGTKLFENTKRLWWPPPECVKSRSRINNVGESVFYGGDSESTCIIETRPEAGDTLTLLEVDLKDPTKLPLITEVGIHQYTGKSNPKYGGTPPELDVSQREFIAHEGLTDTIPLLRDYITEEFLRTVARDNEHEYKITTAIAQILLNEPGIVTEQGIPVNDAVIDGISYPSIAGDKLGVNTAFKTEAVDRLYKPVSCIVYEVKEKKSEVNYIIDRINYSVSIDTDGTIHWAS